MALSHTGQFNIGTRLMVRFALLIALILGGNGLVLWQFSRVRRQTDRLTGAVQQAIVVLQLQVNLLSFHQSLDDLVRSRDSERLVAEAGPLRKAVYEQTRQTRYALSSLQAVSPVDPAFWPTLEAIESILPTQLDAITGLARAGDWEVVQLRLGNQLEPIETQTGILVDSVDRQANRELAQAVEQMRAIQQRIFILVPSTALCSFIVAAWFGWSIARRFIELGTEQRVTERMRIARELHDTLLQSFQASLVQMQAARNIVGSRPQQAVQRLDSAIKMTAASIAEGRRAIQQLRSQPAAQGDLAELLSVTGQELARTHETTESPVSFRVVVQGENSELNPLLQDEVYRIGNELLRNAFRHSRASEIEAELRFERLLLRVYVRDNGKGVDPQILNEGGRDGHWGLAGINERAKQIGGRLDFWSESGRGTEAQLTIPAAVAYRTPPKRWFFRLLLQRRAGT